MLQLKGHLLCDSVAGRKELKDKLRFLVGEGGKYSVRLTSSSFLLSYRSLRQLFPVQSAKFTFVLIFLPRRKKGTAK
jgi:hypothetical protein